METVINGFIISDDKKMLQLQIDIIEENKNEQITSTGKIIAKRNRYATVAVCLQDRKRQMNRPRPVKKS